MNTFDLALLVDRFMRSIHFGLQKRAPDFDREGVGPGGGIILMTLADTGQISLNDLTRRVARDKSQMTRMIRSLESKGLLERRASPTDGRVSIVELTVKGANVTEQLRDTVAEVIDELLAPISETEKHDLKTLISKVV